MAAPALLPNSDPDADWSLPAWLRLGPNVAFDIHPDQIDFMQFLPVSPTETLIREMRAARYLNWRINRQVNAEDTALIARVQAGMASANFTVGRIGESEVCLRNFARKIRELIPEARAHHKPARWSKSPSRLREGLGEGLSSSPPSRQALLPPLPQAGGEK
jgi:hypothetical protein